jgi:hypothetical protein
MYFVREICTDIDVHTTLTRNQPAYWAASTGQPGPSGNNVPVFGTLANDAIMDMATGEYYLRGFIVVIATNAQGEQIRWNHLFGEATIVNYRDGTAWEYNAYAFYTNFVDQGLVVGVPGEINLDGVQYDDPFDQLLFDFFAPGSGAFLGGANTPVVSSAVDTDLTLMILNLDLTLLGKPIPGYNTPGPYRTLAVFETWDENETGLTGDNYCFQKWDSFLLSLFGGHFTTMQTDRGYSRIDAVEDVSCDVWEQQFPGQPPVIVTESIDTPLLGVAVKMIDWFDQNGQVLAQSAAGTALRGFGTQDAVIYFDVTGGGGGEKAGGLGTFRGSLRNVDPSVN